MPLQAAPPRAGAGLSHARSRVLVPLPHVLLQEDQEPQEDHCPSTGAADKQKKAFKRLVCESKGEAGKGDAKKYSDQAPTELLVSSVCTTPKTTIIVLGIKTTRR